MPPSALLLAAIASVLGVLAVSPLSPDMRIAEIGALTAFGLCVASNRSATPWFALLVVAASLAGAAAEFRQQHRATILERRTARYAATILDRTDAGDGTANIVVALDGGLRLIARVRGEVPAIGTHAIVRGRIEPFDEARNPDEPSEREIEGERGYDARLEDAGVLSSAPGSAWDPRAIWLARAHEWAGERLAERLGEPAASVVAGELWGARATLPPKLRDRVSRDRNRARAGHGRPPRRRRRGALRRAAYAGSRCRVS